MKLQQLLALLVAASAVSAAALPVEAAAIEVREAGPVPEPVEEDKRGQGYGSYSPYGSYGTHHVIRQ